MARNMLNEKSKLKYEGQIFPTSQCGDLQIIKYEDARNVHVRFLNTGNVKVAKIYNIKSRKVCDTVLKDNFLEIMGIAKVGFGKYSRTTHPKIYAVWYSMLCRCYNKKTQQYKTSYIGCSVCYEWHVFQNFAQWYESKSSSICGDIDKDILVKNNKVYSPDTCCVVPRAINNVVLKQQKHRGDLPIGVFFIKSNTAKLKKPYGAQCRGVGSGKSGYIGSYDTPEKAFNAYKRAKEKHIKTLAKYYKSVLEPRVYDALMNFSVNIND